MPKNSRRKKATRQHAIRKGQRYMRAWRTAEPTRTRPEPGAEPTPRGPLDYAELGLAHLREIQRIVEARGWVVPDDADTSVDARGRAVRLDVRWDYPGAFGGAQPDEDAADALMGPERPTCTFTVPDEESPVQILVETAGNFVGCDRHQLVRHTLPWTAEGVAALPQLLAQVEATSVKLDLVSYMTCCAGGPCGDRVREHHRQAQEKLPWAREIADEVMATQGGAETPTGRLK